jgi:hypothetical protein
VARARYVKEKQAAAAFFQENWGKAACLGKEPRTASLFTDKSIVEKTGLATPDSHAFDLQPALTALHRAGHALLRLALWLNRQPPNMVNKLFAKIRLKPR